MTTLPPALQPLAAYPQFILWKAEQRNGKTVKLPVDWQTLRKADAHDPAIWMDADAALRTAALYGSEYGLGFVFTEADPFYFLDLDNCAYPDGSGWEPRAVALVGRLPGAAVEISQSGRGLHVIGRTAPIAHRCRRDDLGLELYTSGRFVALTGSQAYGSADTDSTAELAAIVAELFEPSEDPGSMEWTEEPVDGWQGIEDDAELIERAMASKSAGSVFGGRASFADLWTADADALAAAYPSAGAGPLPYDASTADAALAQHLAFWTGGNCERIRTLMNESALRRDKWDGRGEYYLPRTILRACSLQTEYHGVTSEPVVAESLGAPKLRGSKKQQSFAEQIREQVLTTATEEQARTLCASSGPARRAGFWIDNQGHTAAELAAMVVPLDAAERPGARVLRDPEEVTGLQLMPATLQREYFIGCVYVQDLHRVFTPSGAMLKSEQFNATYGGYIFSLDAIGDATTRKAWEAFTESQVLRWPKADGTCFRPELSTGELLQEDGRTLVNTYVDIPTRSEPGDVGPFMAHLERVLPDEGDRAILLSYMAACVQYKGVKFQWAPLLQGTEGNGKTLFTRCVAAAIGRRYTHYPKAMDIDNKFNGWLLNKLFIGVEDIYVPDHRREILETLKPMITGGDGLEIQLKGVDQVTADICANFILNSNHKDALRKTRSDRRFAVFYTAQQTAEDLERDGMTGLYFPKLYRWLRAEGYAYVTHYLEQYEIPDALNPATDCHRAPETSSTGEAVAQSLGGVEQEVLEAIEEGRPGFAGGWVSSVALDKLLQFKNLSRRIPHNKRRDLLNDLGYIWHPALTNGRTNNPVPIDDGKKPKLFIKAGHPHASAEGGSRVVELYIQAQREGSQAQAVAAFAEDTPGRGA